MARIRSVKPEFWSDGKIKRLKDSTALFFLSLFNFADDFGYINWDSLELALKTCRWTPQALQAMVSALARAGLIKCSTTAGVLLITGWEHQYIKDRRASKWNNVTIEWDVIKNDAPRSDEIRLGEDRRGKDRRGEELRVTATASPPAPPPTLETDFKNSLLEQKKKTEAETAATWKAYSTAYEKRYGVMPVRNAKINGQLAYFLKRINKVEAPLVAEFFVLNNNSYYVNRGHSVANLLADAEKLRTEWASGKTVTSITARQIESNDYYDAQLKRIAEGKI